MYVTPDHFRNMGLGIDLTAIDDVSLRSMLYRASATVDAYCNIPLLPQKYDFRGGAIIDEVHEWSTDRYEVNTKPFRFWPWHGPVKTVTQYRMYSTPNVFTEIPVGDVFINNSAGYLEASSLVLTQYGIFGAGVISALIGLWLPQAKVSYTYGYTFTETDEHLEATDGQLYSAQHQWWASSPAPVIKVNGAAAPTNTIDYSEGTVTFAAGLTATDVVTATYNHTLPWQVKEAVGIIAAEGFGEADLRSKGMSGLDTISVGEISLRRSRLGRGASIVADNLAPQAAALLSNFIFETLR